MSEVKRRRGESFEAFWRRFSRKVMQSGRILEVKKGRHYTKKKNHNAQKKSALRRRELQADRDYLKKIGKLPEEFGKNTKRR